MRALILNIFKISSEVQSKVLACYQFFQPICQIMIVFTLKVLKKLFGRLSPSRFQDAYESQYLSDLEYLPSLRRTLTQPNESPVRASSSISESRLLSLPPEIRAMIWPYTIAGQRIALYRENGRLTSSILDERHTRAPGRLHPLNPATVEEEVKWVTGVGPRQSSKNGPSRPQHILAPLVTCRLMYVCIFICSIRIRGAT